MLKKINCFLKFKKSPRPREELYKDKRPRLTSKITTAIKTQSNCLKCLIIGIVRNQKTVDRKQKTVEKTEDRNQKLVVFMEIFPTFSEIV